MCRPKDATLAPSSRPLPQYEIYFNNEKDLIYSCLLFMLMLGCVLIGVTLYILFHPNKITELYYVNGVLVAAIASQLLAVFKVCAKHPTIHKLFAYSIILVGLVLLYAWLHLLWHNKWYESFQLYAECFIAVMHFLFLATSVMCSVELSVYLYENQQQQPQ